jgi:hypothetical protein
MIYVVEAAKGIAIFGSLFIVWAALNIAFGG